MKNYNYFLYEGDAYYEDKKKLKFVNVKDPSVTISYVSLHPDDLERFKEILPNDRAKPYRSAQEKLYRVMSDLSNVIYLTEDSFENLMKKLFKYLESIEDYERMCVLRDIKEFYLKQKSKKKAEIEDYIKHFNKLKK